MAQAVRLISLKLRNFKGVTGFTLNAQGGNVSVYGDNATGKTTLDDAWSWLLFDKDSSNRKDFDIKTLGPDGQVLHNLEHEVEGALEADGRQITLRKVYSEKWTKKRGSATAEFSGHTTDYFIDGVPVQLSEYKGRVAQIADESTFRLLTDPRYFNEQLHWQKRREILLAVCGDVTDQEVIASDRGLAALPDILGNRSLADHRKVIVARRSEINKELDKIPTRIDEATRGLPEAAGSRDQITAEIGRLTQLRQGKAAELTRIDAGGEVAEKQRRLRGIEIDMLDLDQRLRSGADKAIQQERTKHADIAEQAEAKRREIRRLQLDGQEADREIEQLQTRLQTLRQKWNVINADELTLSVEEVCPACGQFLPEEKVQAAREQAVAHFNTKKSADLEANVTEGKRLKGEFEKYQAAKKHCAEAIEQAQAALATLDAEVNNSQGRIDAMLREAPDPAKHPDYEPLRKAKAQVEQDIADLRSGSDTVWQTITVDIADLDNQIAVQQGEVAKIDQRQQGLSRIQDLKGEEKALTAEFERLEQQLYLCDQFTEVQAKLLEERVNGRFVHARFKLFDKLINGGTEPCCETLYQGVPYSTALNSGARTNVGLDIINTLSTHYTFEAPIWIDNSEAVTRLFPVRAQVIRLVVSEADKRLRVETEAAPALFKEAV